MAVSTYEELLEHVGCAVEVATYGDLDNVAIECMDHYCVMLSFDRPGEPEVGSNSEPS